jgi:hypothetical protein
MRVDRKPTYHQIAHAGGIQRPRHSLDAPQLHKPHPLRPLFSVGEKPMQEFKIPRAA